MSVYVVCSDVWETLQPILECFHVLSDLGLAPSLCHPLARKGYDLPTPVQTQSIPLVLSGTNLLARAQTGTGKTAAFGLPMIERLILRSTRHASTRAPRGLVLVPTRELALQVERALATYGSPLRVRVTAIYGGVPMGPQKKALQQGTDIVVATPGRLLDHMKQRTIDLSAIEILTLDEADRMLDMGFLPPLRKVIPALPRTRQTLMFSATFSRRSLPWPASSRGMRRVWTYRTARWSRRPCRTVCTRCRRSASATCWSTS